jgi:hypothetical protein
MDSWAPRCGGGDFDLWAVDPRTGDAVIEKNGGKNRYCLGNCICTQSMSCCFDRKSECSDVNTLHAAV